MVGVLGAVGWTQSPAAMAEDIAQFRREFMAVDKSVLQRQSRRG